MLHESLGIILSELSFFAATVEKPSGGSRHSPAFGGACERCGLCGSVSLLLDKNITENVARIYSLYGKQQRRHTRAHDNGRCFCIILCGAGAKFRCQHFTATRVTAHNLHVVCCTLAQPRGSVFSPSRYHARTGYVGLFTKDETRTITHASLTGTLENYPRISTNGAVLFRGECSGLHCLI